MCFQCATYFAVGQHERKTNGLQKTSLTSCSFEAAPVFNHPSFFSNNCTASEKAKYYHDPCRHEIMKQVL